MTGGFVGIESFGMFVVVYGELTVLEADAFAGEGDDAFDDVLVFDAGCGLAGENFVVASVGEDDDLAAMRDVFLSYEVSAGDWEAIDDDAVIWHKGVFHTGTDDVVAAEDEAVEDDGAENDGENKNNETKRIF